MLTKGSIANYPTYNTCILQVVYWFSKQRTKENRKFSQQRFSKLDWNLQTIKALLMKEDEAH